MGFWDNYTNEEFDNFPVSYNQDRAELRQAPMKGWGEWAGELAGFPKTISYLKGENTGRPESAPGPLYDILPEIGNWITSIPGAAKGAANIPIQAYRRSQIAKEIPQMGEVFKKMGNPLTNLYRQIAGAMPEMGVGMEPAGAVAMDVGGNEARSLPSRARQLVDELKGTWGIDIPYNPHGTKYPWAMITEDAENKLLPEIAKGLGYRGGKVTPNAKGFYLPAQQEGNFLADVTAFRRAAIPTGTPTHEISGHLAAKRVRGYGDLKGQPFDYINEARQAVAPNSPQLAPEMAGDFFEALAQNNPKYAQHFQKYDVYKDLPDAKIGEELWSRDVANQLSPLKKKLAFENPAPEFGDRLRDLGDNLLHPYFKDYGQAPAFSPAIPMAGRFADWMIER